MTDTARVTHNHDRAVRVGQKLNTASLDYRDLADLFACCSDIPELLDEILELRSKLARAQESAVPLEYARLAKTARAWKLNHDGTRAPTGGIEMNLINAINDLPRGDS